MSENKPDKNSDEPITFYEKNYSFRKKYNGFIVITIIIFILISISFTIALITTNNKSGESTISQIPININPNNKYTHCIIWLHGLGGSPENMVNLFTKDIIINKLNSTKIILLRAPLMKVSYYKNRRQTSWFDIFSFPLNSRNTYNFEDAKKSSNFLRNIIEKEAKILGDYQKIFIGGFSQGACISLFTAFNFEKLLGGVIACSGFLFEQTEIIGDKKSLNVYIGHGDRDKLIPFEFHKKTIKRIEEYKGVKKYYYNGYGHSINKDEKKDIEKFLNVLIT